MFELNFLSQHLAHSNQVINVLDGVELCDLCGIHIAEAVFT